MTLCIKFILASGLLAASIIASSPSAASSSPKASKRFFKFQPGDTVYSLLRRHGFTERHIAPILKSNPLPKGFSLAHGESYRWTRSPDGKSAEITVFDPVQDRSIRFWRKNETSGVEEREERFQIRPQRVQGRISGSILGSIMNKLPIQWVAHRFMDAFLIEHNRLPTKLQKGAPFDFLVETKWDGSDLIGYGEILEAGLEVAGQSERRFFVGFPGGGAFIDPNDLKADRPLYSPVNYMRISSLYEPRRLHPIKRRRQPHLGVDFELAEGEPVYAAQEGRVLRSGRQRAAGVFVVIEHTSGIETYYNHLQYLTPGLRPGVRVVNGQQIGAIGCTGYCTKAHLHFAVRRRGQHVDPLTLLRSYPYQSANRVVSYARKR